MLGIETATEVCGVALTEDEDLIAEYRLNLDRSHAERLVPAIERITNDAQLSLKELQLIAVSIGPGSFTSLRIGLATAKGLAFSLALPLVSVVSLDALAVQAPTFWGGFQICALITARKHEAYAAFYRKQSEQSLKRTSKYLLVTLDELKPFVTEPTLFLGNGVRTFGASLVKDLGSKAFLAPNHYSFLS
ncbi:MAG: tRNA (adenosine(37)-N6)-threonylcarbamoyltransferase complex dimerization subunit type 1 TsaB, partial [candidate division KSB1 bacterium]|nr:tRNA (adenosine(37)-N6)-threonylcarbamoyltransferase complex dimerization subunit type 1 TsaB [candidate division KSB1 bacterium]